MNSRLLNLDLYRGLAVLFMILFHFTYDLNHFGFIDLDTTRVTFLVYLRTFIVALFMSAVGMSLYLVYHKKFDPSKYTKRLLILGSVSLLISLVTYLRFPNTWIYFGVIHMIFIASIIGPFFVKKPNLSGVLGVLIVAVYQLGYRMTPLFDLMQESLSLPLHHTEDLAPFVPWFGVVLLGVWAMHHRLIEKVVIPSNPGTQKIAFIGRHTLIIYLVHQPIFFALLGGLSYLSN